MFPTNRGRFGRFALAVVLIGALVVAGSLGAAGDLAASHAHEPTGGGDAGAAADGGANATAEDASRHVESDAPVITSEPKWEPAATPPGNDTVNSLSG